MALVTLNLRPTDKQLREFGLAAILMLCLIGTLLWWMDKIGVIGLAVCGGFGVMLFALSRIRAALIRPIYQALMLITFPIGWLVSHTAMAIFFFGLITPIGFFFKLIGRDPLFRSYDRTAQTYWVPYRQKRAVKDYFRQF